MPIGYLVVESTTAQGDIIVAEANVKVYRNENQFLLETKTDLFGKSDRIPLETVNKDISMNENANEPAYYRYTVAVDKPGFYQMVVHDVQIFENQESYLPIFMIPTGQGDEVMPANESIIPPHHLQMEETRAVAVEANVQNQQPSDLVIPSVIREPIIPKSITVHLGSPQSNAENVTVDFRYYVKNVASSEVYPTWPVEALRANIYAIISIALNRVYTEWYKLKGYDFQITNSTAYDQAFVKDRNIFDAMSKIVDEIFNEYVRKIGFVEPLFTTYCDGKEVQCVGMKQWGSMDLAKQGMNAFEILQYYYGKNIEITMTNRLEDITSSYPGRVLSVGSSGNEVYIMQRYLNRIAIDYPNIPSLYPLNGIFDIRMEASAKAFQRQFNMTADGKIGKATWYKISYIYVAVKKLAQLGSEGERLPQQDLDYPGRPLKEGSRGEAVERLQYFLSVIAEFYESIPDVYIDAVFGRTTSNAVRAFQKHFRLAVDGIVGKTTWDEIVRAFKQVYVAIPPRDQLVPFPGTPLKQGSRGNDVIIMQTYLNEIASYYRSIPTVAVDGSFGLGTKAQVTAFQRQFNLTPDGVMGKASWDAMLEAYASLLNIVPYPGFPLKEGDENRYVSTLQIYLNQIAEMYRAIPLLVVDGNFGPSTKRAVLSFQRQFGLDADGIVGKTTWNKLLEVYLSDIRSLPNDVLYDTTLQTVSDQASARTVYNQMDDAGK